MGISIVQNQPSGPAPTGGSATVTFTSTPTPGNVLFFSVGHYANLTVTPPAGLTQIIRSANSTAGVVTYYRVVQAGDGTTWTFTLNDFLHVVGFELSGVDTTTPVDNTPGTTVAASTATQITTPTTTPTMPGTLAFACASTDANEASFATSGAWSLAATGVGAFHSHAVATQAITGTSATTGATITYPSASIAAATTILFRPASAATSTLWAAAATGTTSAGTNWTTTTNATGANDAAFATWANTTSGASGTLEVSSFGAQTAIGSAPSAINSVRATIYGYVTNTSRVTGATAQLFSGTTAIGAAVSVPGLITTTTTNSQTVTFPTAPTWAQLADLRVRVVFTRAAVTQAGNALVDAVGVVVTYPLDTPNTAAGSITLGGTATATAGGPPAATATGSITLNGSATVTVAASETWTGANGSPWPAQWTLVAGTADIQNNQGRLLPPVGSYAVASEYLSGMPATASTEVVADVLYAGAGSGEAYASLGVQSTATAGSNGVFPASGYDLGFFSPHVGGLGITVGRSVGGTRTTLIGNTAVPSSTTVATTFRFRVVPTVGGTVLVQVRAWLSNTPEPSTWLVSFTDTTPYTTAGRIRWGTANGAPTTQQDIRLDNLTVTAGATYPTGTAMQNWLAAAAAKNATVLVIGDSLSEGQGALTKGARWLDVMQSGVRSDAAVTGGGVGYLPAWFSVYGPDSTWTPYSGRTGTHTNDVGTYSPGRRADTMTAGATTTYTVTGTAADLWWLTGYGSFTYKVDAAAAVTVDTSTGTNGVAGRLAKTAITLGASGSHTVVITATTAVHFAGVMVYDGDTTSGIRFVDAAKVGSFSGDFAGMTQVWADFAPDLAIIELGVNDYLHTPNSSAQVKTNLAALISEIRAAAGKPMSVAVVLPAPVTVAPDAGQTEAWAAYKTAIQSVAADDPSVQLISWESLGSAPNSNFSTTDNLHLSNTGQAAVASIMRTALASSSATAATATGAITLGGTATVQAVSSATGSITLSGTVTARVPASSSGSITLAGSGTARAVATAAGSITLGGTGAARASAAAAGTVTLGGTGTGTPSAANSATGSITLAGTAAATSRAALSGVITIGGTATATATVTGSGSIVLGGTVTARVPATAAGAVFLSGLVNARAAATLVAGTITLDGAATATTPAYTPHIYGTATLAYTPGTAVLATDGTSTAVLAAQTLATAVLATVTAATADVAATVGTAVLANDGTSTAVLTELPATAELQLV